MYHNISRCNTYPLILLLTQSQGSLRAGVQLFGFAELLNGFFGSCTQNPPNELLYTNVVPSSFVTVLPSPPHVAKSPVHGRNV